MMPKLMLWRSSRSCSGGCAQRAPLSYSVNPFSRHPLHLVMQLLYSPMQASPLKVQAVRSSPAMQRVRAVELRCRSHFAPVAQSG
jgi:hypothetical protein